MILCKYKVTIKIFAIKVPHTVCAYHGTTLLGQVFDHLFLQVFNLLQKRKCLSGTVCKRNKYLYGFNPVPSVKATLTRHLKPFIVLYWYCFSTVLHNRQKKAKKEKINPLIKQNIYCLHILQHYC